MRGLLLAVAVVGCGDGIAAPDAVVVPDAAGGLVRTRFAVEGVPLGGHVVYFQNRDSSLVQATRTDAEGRANAFMAPGGFVTVVQETGSTTRLHTYVDVRPGDELVIGRGAIGTPQQFFLRIPPAPNNASFYQLYSPCGGADVRGAEVSAVQVAFADCDPVTDLLVVAFGEGIQYLHRAGAGIDASLVTLAGPWAPMTTSTVDVVDLPATVSSLSLLHGLAGGRRLMYTANDFLATPQGSGQAVVEVPVIAGATMVTVLTPNAFGEQQVIDWRPSSASTTIDYDEVVLRAYVEPPRYEPTRSLLAWREDASGAVANLVLSSFQWFDPDRQENFMWTVAAPRGEEPLLRLPVLPEARMTPAGSLFFTTHASSLVEGDVDYARTHLIGLWEPDVSWPIEGAAGRIVSRDPFR